MADTYLNFSGLQHYDEKLKEYINNAAGGATTVYVDGVKVDSVSFDSDPQTQLNDKQLHNIGLDNGAKVLITDAQGNITASNISSQELNYLSNVTVDIQEQLDTKQDLINGAASTITSNNLTKNRVLVSNNGGKVAVSNIATSTLNYISNVNSDIQGQLNEKANIADLRSLAYKNKISNEDVWNDANIAQSKIDNLVNDLSNINANIALKQDHSTGTANVVVITDADGNISTSTLNASQLPFMEHVKSDIQDQLDNMATTLGLGQLAYLDNITNANVAPDADIAQSKIANLVGTFNSVNNSISLKQDHNLGNDSEDRVVITDSNGNISISNLSSNKLLYLTNVTADIQTQLNSKTDNASLGSLAFKSSINNLDIAPDADIAQSKINNLSTDLNNIQNSITGIYAALDNKQDTITGAASSVVSSDLKINKIVLSDDAGKIIASDMNASQLDFLANVTSDIQAQLDNTITEDDLGTLAFKNTITDDDVADDAAIEQSKIANLLTDLGNLSTALDNKLNKNLSTANRVVITNDIGYVITSDVSSTKLTKLNYLENVNSDIQAQLNSKVSGVTVNGTNVVNSSTHIAEVNVPTSLANLSSDATHRVVTDDNISNWNTKQDAIVGGASTITSDDLSSGLVLISSDQGKVIVSNISVAELDALKGISSDIQEQLDNKADSEDVPTGLGNLAYKDAISNSDVAADADIAQSKILNLVTDIANINEDISNKQDLIEGAASSITFNDLTAYRVLISNDAGKVIASSINSNKLLYINNATSDLQDQIDSTRKNLNTDVKIERNTSDDSVTVSLLYSANSSTKCSSSVIIPVSNAFINASYDNGTLTFTRENNSTLDVDIEGSTGFVRGVEVNSVDVVNSTTKIAEITVPTTLAELSDDATHRLVTDTDISNWNAKQDHNLGPSNKNKVLVSDDAGNITAGSISTSILAYLANVNSDIQIQLNSKVNTSDIASTPTQNNENPISSDGVWQFTSLMAICKTGGATAAKVISAQDVSFSYTLKQGNWINIYFTEDNTVNEPTLNIKGTGAYPIYVNGVRPTYSGGDNLRNSDLKAGWHLFYYDGANYHTGGFNTQLGAPILSGQSSLSTSRIICAGISNTYSNLAPGLSINTLLPILYNVNYVSSGSVVNSSYITYTDTLSNMFGVSSPGTLTAYQPIFLKGQVDGYTFKVAASNWYTQTPSSEDGAIQYLLVGYADTTTTVRLLSTHPIYAFVGNKLTLHTDTSDFVTISGNQTISGSKTFTSGPILQNNVGLNSKYNNNTVEILRITASGNVMFGGDSTAGHPQIPGNILPTRTIRPADVSAANIDLGTSDYRWRDLYLDGNISDGTASINVSQIINKLDQVRSANIIYGTNSSGDQAIYNLTDQIQDGSTNIVTSGGIYDALAEKQSQIDSLEAQINTVELSQNYVGKKTIETFTSLDSEIFSNYISIDDVTYDIADKSTALAFSIKGHTVKDPGGLYDSELDGIGITSRNLWQGNDTTSLQYIGHYQCMPDGTLSPSDSVNCFKLEIKENTDYYIRKFSAGNFGISWIIHWLDSNDNWKSSDWSLANVGAGIVMSPIGSKYLRFSVPTSAVDNEYIFNPSVTSFNGLYEPYSVKIIGLPETQTLRGINAAQDEITINPNASDNYFTVEKITRIALLELSSLTFTQSGGVYSATLPGVQNDTTNFLLSDYSSGGTGAEAEIAGTTLQITTSSTPTGIIEYELATPEEELIADDVDLSDVSLIRAVGGTISVIGNGNVEYVQPDVSLVIVYQETDSIQSIDKPIYLDFNSSTKVLTLTKQDNSSLSTIINLSGAGIVEGVRVNGYDVVNDSGIALVNVSVNGTQIFNDSSKEIELSIPYNLSDLNSDSTHRTVSDSNISTWNNKQNSNLGSSNGNRVLITGATGTIGVSGTYSTQLSYLDNVTSDIQAQLDNSVHATLNSGVVVAGTTKNTYTYDRTAIYAPNGLIMGGTAAAAGLVTRGICGVATPTTGGACTKDNLYINYDNTNTYNSSRQLVLQAGSVGNPYGYNVYQYCAVRGDAFKNYIDNNVDGTVNATASKNAKRNTSGNLNAVGFNFCNISTPTTKASMQYNSTTEAIEFNFY